MRYHYVRSIYVLTALAVMPAYGQPAARIFYSDIQSGPNTGGQNGDGAHVTLYGYGFGAARGSSTVTVGGGAAVSYPVWSDRKVTFQLGSSAASGDIYITTPAGRSNAIPFTVRAGKIYFVSPSGSDTAPGSFAQPWATLKKAVSALAPGDTVYAMNGVSQTIPDQYNDALSVMSSGAPGNPKALLAYPGATVRIGTETGSPMYGLRVPGSPYSDWVFGGLRISGSSAVILIAMTRTRFVGNELTCPTGDNGFSACFIVAQSEQIAVLGNIIHRAGAAGASKLYHSLYLGTDANHIEVGWNVIEDNNSCRGIQVHSTSLSASNGFNQYDISLHDNVIRGQVCDGIALATVDPSRGPIQVFNNIIYDVGKGPDPRDGAAGYTCVYVAGGVNNGSPGSGVVEVFNNTLYNCGSRGGGSAGAISRPNRNSALSLNLRNNLVYQTSAEPYLTSDTYAGLITGSNNLWYGSPSAPPPLTRNVMLDPRVVNVAAADFHLQATSPAIDAGVLTSAATDFDGVRRPQQSAPDIGAFEYSPTDSLPPSMPANLTATATSSSQVSLSWAASTDNIGVAGYRIYRSGALISSTPGLSYVDTGLTASTSYSYAVSAYDAAGNSSPLSGTAITTTPAQAMPAPAAPLFSPGGGTYAAALSVTLNSATPGATIRYTTDGSNPTPASGTIYAGPFVVAATVQLKAIAYSSTSAGSSVSSSTYTIGAPSSPFVKSDVITGGAWQGVYGSDGYAVAAGSSSYPAYASATVSGSLSYIWASSTSDTRALQTGSTRTATCWYAPSTITIDVDLKDGNAHQVALYFVDWDNRGRTQRVDVYDAANTLLDTRTLANFGGGQYLVWNLRGRVQFRLTNLSTTINIVVSGIFFGAAPAPTAPPPTPAPSAATASFVKVDTATIGSWRNVFGADGYVLTNETASLPSYAQLTTSGANLHTWVSSTSDARALQRSANPGDRAAACWYFGTMILDLNLTDANSHQVALYFVDWDERGRSETVEILDAGGNVLDSRPMARFVGGQYLVWNLSGRVRIRITNLTTHVNAVLSGVFFR